MITAIPQHCNCDQCRQAGTTIETLTKINAELYKLVETQVIGRVQINMRIDHAQIALAKSDEELARFYARTATAMAWADLSKRLEKHVDLFRQIDELKIQILLGPERYNQYRRHE